MGVERRGERLTGLLLVVGDGQQAVVGARARAARRAGAAERARARPARAAHCAQRRHAAHARVHHRPV